MTPKQTYLEHFFRDLVPGDFPLRVSAETTNHCNLKCDYCPREDSGRGFGHMELGLFDALSDQCAHRETVFSPQGFGEPFADARFGDLLRRAHARGVRYLDVTSNGTLLTEENCRALIEAPAALISIELDGADPAVFEASRKGASYAEVVENVKRLLRMREEARSEFPYVCLSVLRLPEVLPTLPAFYALWKPLLRPTDEIFEALPATWTGDRPMPGKRAATEAELRTRPPCRHLYKTLQVYYDGRTSPCTYDHACRLQVGDASRQSLDEIWNGEPLRRLRELHESGRSGELDVCRGCPDHLV
jgi:MoaA/NifB/PqqE/SkfB family radical SAM enzyme